MGHNRGPRLPECSQRFIAYGDRYYFLHHNPAQNSVLHGEPDPSHRPHFVPLRPRLLSTRRGRREVTLGISILLSLVVFLLLVSKILPPTSLVLPLIAKYLLFTFIMNTVSILVTVVVINWNFRGPRTHSMPNWVRLLFLKYLPIVLFMRRPKKTRLR